MSELLSYSDVYEHLLDVFYQNGKAVGRQARVLRRAIIEAYRLLPSLANWEYFRRTGSINTSLPVTYEGVAYTVADLKLTLSSGTWGDDVEMGSVTIADRRYRIIRKLSTTVLQLKEGPAADVTGSVRWSQVRYLLPMDLGDIVELTDTGFYSFSRVPAVNVWEWQEMINIDSMPAHWAILPSAANPGRLELWLSGSVESSRTLRYLYQARNTVIRFNSIESSTANGNVTVSGSTATFSEGILNSNHVGSVFRTSVDADSPTSEFGKLVKDNATGVYENTLNPAISEKIIISVESTVSATLSSAAESQSTVGFSMSPHIDVNFEGMWELLLRLAEEQYDILTRAEASIRRTSKAERMMAFRAALRADAPGQERSANRRIYFSVEGAD